MRTGRNFPPCNNWWDERYLTTRASILIPCHVAHSTFQGHRRASATCPGLTCAAKSSTTTPWYTAGTHVSHAVATTRPFYDALTPPLKYHEPLKYRRTQSAVNKYPLESLRILCVLLSIPTESPRNYFKALRRHNYATTLLATSIHIAATVVVSL